MTDCQPDNQAEQLVSGHLSWSTYSGWWAPGPILHPELFCTRAPEEQSRTISAHANPRWPTLDALRRDLQCALDRAPESAPLAIDHHVNVDQLELLPGLFVLFLRAAGVCHSPEPERRPQAKLDNMLTIDPRLVGSDVWTDASQQTSSITASSQSWSHARDRSKVDCVGPPAHVWFSAVIDDLPPHASLVVEVLEGRHLNPRKASTSIAMTSSKS